MSIFDQKVVFPIKPWPELSHDCRLPAAGKLRKMAPRLYTTNLQDPFPEIAKRNPWKIVAGYFHGALLADRTALEMTPAADGSVFFFADQPRNIDVWGLKLRPRYGQAPVAGDFPFREGLTCYSTARAYLAPSKRT